jgi:Rho GTPase-activating protein 39
LAKLQILKQTADPPPMRDDSSSNSLTKELSLQPPTIQQIQAQHQKMSQQHKNNNTNNGTNSSSNKTNSTRRSHDSSERIGHSKQSFQIQQAKLRDLATSNSAAGNASDDFIVGESYKFCKHSGSDGIKRSSQKYMDSGKSSDSSLSSANHRKAQECGSLRTGSSHEKSSSINKYNPESSYRMLQESSSAHNILDRGQQLISSSISNSSDIAISNKNASHSTPLMKKRAQYDSQMSHGSKSRDHPSKSKQHQSFDHPGPSTSITRSGSFMSPVNEGQPRMQQRKGSFEGYGSDDSMHEKYFKSVENTPITRRRHTTTSKMGLKSSDSSPQSPISPQHLNHHQQQKSIRPSHLGLESLTKNKKSSHKYDPDMVNMNIAVKQDR